MEHRNHFCTCDDHDCRLNPHNGAKGCDLCIQKNLKLREIPSCFYKLVNEDTSELKEYTFESFVQFYLQNKK